MPRVKIAPKSQLSEVTYSPEHWALLHDLRQHAIIIMDVLEQYTPFLHGSVARGDISSTSDLDIVVAAQVPEFQIQVALEDIGLTPAERWLIQATPLAAIKAHLVYPDNLTVYFPLVPLYPREMDFYQFGGAVQLTDLYRDLRVPGVNKALLFIQPTPTGHLAERVTVENADQIAKTLHINPQTIKERIRVLTRRDSLGRTGVFLRHGLGPEDSFGGVLQSLERTNPAARRRIGRRKL